MKILIIEDDLTLSKNLKKLFLKEGFAVDIAISKEDGQNQTEINEYDCLVLDIGLPDGSGFDLLKELREQGNKTPIIIATARGQVEDRVQGLDLGADDYLSKPINSDELVARIRAVIRRATQNPLPIIHIGSLTVHPAEHSAMIDNHPLELTAKEFAVLEYLSRHSGQAVTRTMLMEHIWGSDFETFSNVIDVYIRNLRRKIVEYTSQNLIKTIRGKGYILNEN